MRHREHLMVPLLVVSASRAFWLRQNPKTFYSDARWLFFLLLVVSDGLASFGGIAASLVDGNSVAVWLCVVAAALSGAPQTVEALRPSWLHSLEWIKWLEGGCLAATLLAAITLSLTREKTYWGFLAVLPPFFAVVLRVFYDGNPEKIKSRRQPAANQKKAAVVMKPNYAPHNTLLSSYL